LRDHTGSAIAFGKLNGNLSSKPWYTAAPHATRIPQRAPRMPPRALAAGLSTRPPTHAHAHVHAPSSPYSRALPKRNVVNGLTLALNAWCRRMAKRGQTWHGRLVSVSADVPEGCSEGCHPHAASRLGSDASKGCSDGCHPDASGLVSADVSDGLGLGLPSVLTLPPAFLGRAMYDVPEGLAWAAIRTLPSARPPCDLHHAGA